MSERRVLGHLTDGTTSLVLVGDAGMPELVHWGDHLGDGYIDVDMFERPTVGGGLDIDPPVGLVAEGSRGWFGRPGIGGSRPDGSDFAPRFDLVAHDCDGRRFTCIAEDRHAHLALSIEVTLTPSGVVRVDAALRNGGSADYRLDALRLAFPIDGAAGELMTVGGRHAYEFVRRRTRWGDNALVVENRHGKTSHERLGLVIAGTPDFGETRGEVWACHIGWSGNFEFVADAITDGRKVLQVGELLGPSEVVLAEGEEYRAPPVYLAHSASGLNGVSQAFHRFLRQRPGHPRLPRPIHINTWEAVYFDHDAARLLALADVAARVGVDRFVLDDGWFGSRRDDRSGLGDWVVSGDVWPNGLTPLIEHVRGLGMGFGLWVEPEMISPDSDLHRANPDWVLADLRRPPLLGRNQLVLDVGRSEVRDHLFEAIDGLLREYPIEYLKWDHNRDLVAPTSAGRFSVRRQTLGTYELIDRIRTAHPGVEIETCASGGGRVDFGILERTDRVWTSDSNDPLDRLGIQAGFTLLFPPELMGSHVGGPRAHSTGRASGLAFRGATALFGSFGVEWNLLEAEEGDLRELAAWIDLHRRVAPLCHTGQFVRSDHPDPCVDVRGVVAEDRSEALFSVSRLRSGPTHHTPPIRFVGLDPERRYRIEPQLMPGSHFGSARSNPSWLDSGVVATGRQLMVAGLSAPQLDPETSVVISLAEDRPPD